MIPLFFWLLIPIILLGTYSCLTWNKIRKAGNQATENSYMRTKAYFVIPENAKVYEIQILNLPPTHGSKELIWLTSLLYEMKFKIPKGSKIYEFDEILALDNSKNFYQIFHLEDIRKAMIIIPGDVVLEGIKLFTSNIVAIFLSIMAFIAFVGFD